MDIIIPLALGGAALALIVVLLEAVQKADEKANNREFRKKVLHAFMDQKDADYLLELSKEYPGVPLADFFKEAKPKTRSRVVSVMERGYHIGMIHKMEHDGYNEDIIAEKIIDHIFDEHIIGDPHDNYLASKKYKLD